MIMRREWAMPNKNTFSILPIQNLLYKYCKGEVIVEPFANTSKWGTIRNDLNPEYDTQYHMDALEFLKMFDDASVDVVLYDPPFSIHQAQECYKSYGAERLKTQPSSMKYWGDCKNEVARILKVDGIAICCGWSSNGIGINRGFEMLEVLLVPHGGSKNDTIVTVEAKRERNQMSIFDIEEYEE